VIRRCPWNPTPASTSQAHQVRRHRSMSQRQRQRIPILILTMATSTETSLKSPSVMTESRRLRKPDKVCKNCVGMRQEIGVLLLDRSTGGIRHRHQVHRQICLGDNSLILGTRCPFSWMAAACMCSRRATPIALSPSFPQSRRRAGEQQMPLWQMLRADQGPGSPPGICHSAADSPRGLTGRREPCHQLHSRTSSKSTPLSPGRERCHQGSAL